MIDDEGKTFRYTTAQRLKQTQRNKHQKIIKNYKK